MYKRILGVVTLMLACLLMFMGCDYLFEDDILSNFSGYFSENTPSKTLEETTEIITESAEDIEHREIEAAMGNTDFKTPYSELYEIYESVIAHTQKHNCTIDMEELLENMLYGEWKDSSDNYILYTYCYKDYNNTEGSAWYSTNLLTSQISGSTYYYYFCVDGNNLIMGLQDNITEERIENYVISFNKNSISVENKNDGLTYDLELNDDYSKVQEGNAKMAYVYIAKKIFTFKNPSSVTVTSCYVDYEEKVVYATIQATNSYGGSSNTDYQLYEIAGRYYITEYSHNYPTNIDLDELNQKLQKYVSSGG